MLPSFPTSVPNCPFQLKKGIHRPSVLWPHSPTSFPPSHVPVSLALSAMKVPRDTETQPSGIGALKCLQLYNHSTLKVLESRPRRHSFCLKRFHCCEARGDSAPLRGNPRPCLLQTRSLLTILTECAMVLSSQHPGNSRPNKSTVLS